MRGLTGRVFKRVWSDPANNNSNSNSNSNIDDDDDERSLKRRLKPIKERQASVALLTVSGLRSLRVTKTRRPRHKAVAVRTTPRTATETAEKEKEKERTEKKSPDTTETETKTERDTAEKEKAEKNKRTKSGVVTRRFSARVLALDRALRYVLVGVLLIVVD